jgi:hypothetical protein
MPELIERISPGERVRIRSGGLRIELDRPIASSAPYP